MTTELYNIELNPEMKSFICPHSGEQSITVWGSISKNNAALAVYFANLMTRHERASARLTISIGGWGEEAEKKRKWIYIEARPTAGSYEMMVRQPEESLYHGKPIVGAPMTRAEVLSSDQRREIFEIADYIGFNDPAVKSYLSGEEIGVEGRNGNIQ